jgi:hypothetical protein
MKNIGQNNSSKKDFCKNISKVYHNISPLNIITSTPNKVDMHHIIPKLKEQRREARKIPGIE